MGIRVDNLESRLSPVRWRWNRLKPRLGNLDATFAVAWVAGRALTLEQAIAEALNR
jgi:hypothetical protein